MSKYIIRNCPCFDKRNTQCLDTPVLPLTDMILCQDCTDCVLKQIVELCKHDIEQWKAVLNVNILEGCVSNKILKLLDIEECEG